MPGKNEKFQWPRDVVFWLIGDFGKAHRRFKYRSDECGYLACRVADTDPYVYVNLVGTFGVAFAPYWWGRLSGSLLRLVHQLLGPGSPVGCEQDGKTGPGGGLRPARFTGIAI